MFTDPQRWVWRDTKARKYVPNKAVNPKQWSMTDIEGQMS